MEIDKGDFIFISLILLEVRRLREYVIRNNGPNAQFLRFMCRRMKMIGWEDEDDYLICSTEGLTFV